MTGATVFGDFVNVFNMSSEPIRMTPDVASPKMLFLDLPQRAAMTIA
ncbi:hypothetical protein XOC_3269 [Xanthomonas oryzae pv. oryzicola BLS256]|uniref:Uncharacterized protein n=1 Tax=Xanthomonas oryzae pv. oryzicola (strain BLS256) TaxID=383407 RepID=G7TBV4_XANOB|nr:hypothetical protein XOC_3269 [Xanthomonas oryzae pv. oryzicola BLS256]